MFDRTTWDHDSHNARLGTSRAGDQSMSRLGWVGALRAGDCARNSDHRYGTGQCRCLRNSRAKHIRARNLICWRCRRRLALVDVLESGNDDPVQGIGNGNRFLNDLSSRRRRRRCPAARLQDRLSFFRACPTAAINALVGNGYTSYQISPNLWMGVGFNAPFGLSVSFQEPWAGRNFGGDTTIKTYNAESQHRLSNQRLDQHRRRRAGSVRDRPSIHWE